MRHPPPEAHHWQETLANYRVPAWQALLVRRQRDDLLRLQKGRLAAFVDADDRLVLCNSEYRQLLLQAELTRD